MARCSASIGRCTFPDDPLYYEKFYFTPGDLGFRAGRPSYGKIGVLICWDQWYPEARAAHGVARRGDSFLSDGDRLASEREERIRRARSTPRGKPSSAATRSRTAATCASPNRIGHEVIKGVGGDGIEFWGQSFVAGTSGEILAKAARTEEETLIVPA